MGINRPWSRSSRYRVELVAKTGSGTLIPSRSSSVLMSREFFSVHGRNPSGKLPCRLSYGRLQAVYLLLSKQAIVMRSECENPYYLRGKTGTNDPVAGCVPYG